jgi:hypothetical protein
VRRLALVALLSCGIVLGQVPRAEAQEINQNTQCQQLFRQMADPVAAQMLYYVQAANAYPMLPNGRPPVSPYPYAAYPWGQAVFGGPGGPGWNFASAYGPWAMNGVGLTTAWGYPGPVFTPPGGTALSAPFVANQVVTQAGGIGQVAPGDLINLGLLRQGLVGNVLAATDTRQGIIGNRLAAADFNLNYAGFPLAQAVGLREVLEGIQIYVSNACPTALPNGDGTNGGGQRT